MNVNKTRLFFPAIISAACIFAGSTSIDAQQPDPVTLLSWNLEHFTDPFDDPYISTERDDNGSGKSNKQLKLLAEAIEQSDADILLLQEVESDRAIRFFLDEYLPDHSFKYSAAVESTTWYQNTAILSKYPIGTIFSLREVELYNPVIDRTENKYNSRLLFAEVKLNDDYTVLLGNMHLKAGRDPEDPVWRETQIIEIKNFLKGYQKMKPDSNILIGGDMNFLYNSPEYFLMKTEAPELMDATASFDGYLYTHASDSPSRQLDYFFYDKTLKNEVIADSAQVPTLLSLEQLAEISDHLPVMIKITPEESK